MNRRRYVGLFAGIGGIAGCLSPSEFVQSDRTEEPNPEEYVDDWHDEPDRGRGLPIVRADGGVEQVQNEEDVRVEYDGSKSIEEWRDGSCIRSGAEAVKTVLDKRVSDLQNVGVGVAGSGAVEETHVSVIRELILDNDGNLLSKPRVGFAELRDATPRAAITLDEREEVVRICDPPVFVYDSLLVEA